MEEFRIIDSYNNSISNLGRVRNNTTQLIKKPGSDGNGYYHVNLKFIDW